MATTNSSNNNNKLNSNKLMIINNNNNNNNNTNIMHCFESHKISKHIKISYRNAADNDIH